MTLLQAPGNSLGIKQYWKKNTGIQTLETILKVTFCQIMALGALQWTLPCSLSLTAPLGARCWNESADQMADHDWGTSSRQRRPRQSWSGLREASDLPWRPFSTMLGLAIQKPEGHYVYLMLDFKADADGRQLCSRPAVLHRCWNNSITCCWPWGEVCCGSKRATNSLVL